MKRLMYFLFLAIYIISCKKENGSFIAKYQAIYGTWSTQAISYDSSGVNITRATPFNRLVINDNLEYQIYKGGSDAVENGTISIITQTSDKLELYFAAKYPDYSSYAGSHIFGMSNAILFSLSNDEMIFKSSFNGLYNNLEFYFIKM
jgi:hypothetical protein